MPDQREIERLKKNIRALADEDAILASRGESYIDLLPPPEPEPMPDVNASHVDLGEFSASAGETAAPSDDQAIPDFSTLLQDIDLSSPEPETADEAPGEAAGEAPVPAFDLSDLSFDQPVQGDAGGIQEGLGDMDALLGQERSAGPAAVDDSLEAFPSFDDAAFDRAPVEPASPVESRDDSGFGIPDAEAFPETPISPESADSSPLADSFDLPESAEPSEPGEASPFGDFDLGAFAAPEQDLVPESGPTAEPEAISEPGSAPGQEASFGQETDLGLGDVAAESLFSELPPDAEVEAPGEDISFPEASADPGASGDSAFGDFAMPDEGAAAGGGDSFEPPAFDIPGFDAAGPKTPTASPGGAPSAPAQEDDPFASFDFSDTDMPSAGGSDPFDSELASLDEPVKAHDNFSIDAVWGQSMPGVEASSGAFAPPGAFSRAGGKKKGGEEIEELAEEVALTEKELDRLQDSLLSYPLNLRLEIEQSIANEVLSEGQAAQLIRFMVDGKNAPDTAALLGRFLSKRIRVPSGFEKRTGEQFEAEKGTFWYAFKTNILPMLAIAAGIVLAVAVIGFLGYQFVWRPLYADSIYRSGYAQIKEEDFTQAERMFDTAVGIDRVRAWYFRYARAYIEHKQFTLAEKKYQELLKRYKKDKQAALEYAGFESKTLLAFEKAEKILQTTVLYWKPQDPDGLLLLGDNYLDWAEESEDQAQRQDLWEKARKSFAALVRMYGRKDLYMGRMLLYFIRVDKMKEVIPLKDYYANTKGPKLDSAIYAELGGYLMDKGDLEEVQTLLALGVKKDPSLPDNHYQLSRYYRAHSNLQEERKALARAVRGYESMPSLNRKRLMAYIDSLNWSGDWSYKNKEYLDAQAFYEKAIGVYEDSLRKRRFDASGRFGEIYSNLGDIYYYDRSDFENAFSLYQAAERNGYSTSDTAYKRGYVRYRGADYKSALAYFYQASGDFKVTDNLLLAMANTLYYREDYSAASAYYLQLARAMQDGIDRIQYMDPQDKPDQSLLVRTLLIAQNNMGVCSFRIAARSGNAAKRAEAMLNFSESMRLFDVMNRDQETMLRPLGANLSFLNMDGILHPSSSFIPQIYPDISKDLVDSDEKIAQDAQIYVGKQ
jgi:tetratricopeptide (TPR) repeat protein